MPPIDVLIPAISALVAGLITFLTTRATNKKDIAINDRVQLSKDEQQFRAEILAELKGYKEEVRALTGEVAELKATNLRLELQVTQLTEANQGLQTENRELSGQIAELMIELKKRKQG